MRSSWVDGGIFDISDTEILRHYDHTARTRPKMLSLKASSAKSMSKNSVHISKLTEAAWIQDARKQSDRRDKLIELFRDYRAITDAIIMLRRFTNAAGVIYELIEIPTSLFEPIDRLDTKQPSSRTFSVPPNSEDPT